MQPIVREWRPDWPCPVGQIWATWRKGAGDPTYRVDRGRHWRGIRTPLGPATLAAQPLNIEGVIVAEAWGEGAEWVLDQLPAMLATQQRLAVAIPEFKPYASMTQTDIDDCGKEGERGVAVTSD